MTDLRAKELYNRWRSAQEKFLARDKWYRLGGRDFMHGLDCSGYVAYVLSEIGCKIDPAGLTVYTLYHQDIWGDKPDHNSFGEYAELFEVYFNDAGDGPNGLLDHIGLRYKWAYGSHVTSGYFETGHQNSLSGIRQRVRNLFGNVDWINPDDTFNGAAFRADIITAMTQGLEPMSIVRSTRTNVLLGVDDINSVPSNETTLLQLRDVESDPNTNTEPALVERAYDMFTNYAKNYAFVGGILGMVRDSYVEVEDPALELAEGVTYASKSSLIPSLDVLVEAIDGKYSAQAIEWVYNQLTSKDVEAEGQKNGAQVFPRSRRRSEINGSGPIKVKYLQGANFSKYFGVV